MFFNNERKILLNIQGKKLILHIYGPSLRIFNK